MCKPHNAKTPAIYLPFLAIHSTSPLVLRVHKICLKYGRAEVASHTQVVSEFYGISQFSCSVYGRNIGICVCKSNVADRRARDQWALSDNLGWQFGLTASCISSVSIHLKCVSKFQVYAGKHSCDVICLIFVIGNKAVYFENSRAEHPSTVITRGFFIRDGL